MRQAVKSFATAIERQPGLCDAQTETAQRFMAAVADLVQPLSWSELADMDGSNDCVKIPDRLISAHSATHVAARLAPVSALNGVLDAITSTPEVWAAAQTIFEACRRAGYVEDAKSAA